MLFLILLFYMEEFIFYSKTYLEKAYIVTFVWQFFHVSNYWKCSNKHQRSYRCILCVYPCIFSGARGQKRMNSSDSSPVHMGCNTWTVKFSIFSEFQNIISDNPTTRERHSDALRTKIDMWLTPDNFFLETKKRISIWITSEFLKI